MIDKTVDKIDWAKPGYYSAVEQLDDFIKKRLKLYGDKRNNPLIDALSNLSPWFHFGMISVQRCILEISKYKSTFKNSVDAFMEEAIIRRELSDNFCFYNPNYDNIKGAHEWSIKTLNEHR